MARGRRRGRRRGVRRGVRRRPGRKMLNGGMIRGRMHPPSNSASPWNNYVVTFTWSPQPAKEKQNFQQLQDLTVQHVRDNLTSELGLSGSVDMRIRRIDVWTQPQTANSNRNTIVMAPFDWTTCGSIINRYEGWGTVAQPAHCHYVWPKSITNVVLGSGSSCSVVRFDVRDANFAFIVKCHLMWRKSAPNPLKTVPGIATGLRTRVYEPPPPGTDYVMIDHTSAMGPLATVVEAFTLRSE